MTTGFQQANPKRLGKSAKLTLQPRFSLLLLMAFILALVTVEFSQAEAMSQAQTFYKKGKERLNQKLHKDALTYFDLSLEADPNYTPALTERASLYLLLQQHAKAIDDCARVLKLKDVPTKTVVKCCRVLAECHAETGHYKEGENYLDRAIKLDPDNHKLYAYRAGIRKVLKEDKGAIADYSAVIRLRPNESPSEYSYRGRLYAAAGRHRDAVQDFTTAIKQTSKNEKFLVSRAEAYLKLRVFARCCVLSN